MRKFFDKAAKHWHRDTAIKADILPANIINDIFPVDILAEIFKHLHFRELKKIFSVCRTWNQANKSEIFWSLIWQHALNEIKTIFPEYQDVATATSPRKKYISLVAIYEKIHQKKFKDNFFENKNNRHNFLDRGAIATKAVEHGHVNVLQFLLNTSLNLNTIVVKNVNRNNHFFYQMSLLFYAGFIGDDKQCEIVKFLLEHGADCNQTTISHTTHCTGFLNLVTDYWEDRVSLQFIVKNKGIKSLIYLAQAERAVIDNQLTSAEKYLQKALKQNPQFFIDHHRSLCDGKGFSPQLSVDQKDFLIKNMISKFPKADYSTGAPLGHKRII
jgi:hypothetical protein